MQDRFDYNRAIETEIKRVAAQARHRIDAVVSGLILGGKIANAVRTRERRLAQELSADTIEIQLILTQLRVNSDKHVSQVASSAAQSFREQRRV